MAVVEAGPPRDRAWGLEPQLTGRGHPCGFVSGLRYVWPEWKSSDNFHATIIRGLQFDRLQLSELSQASGRAVTCPHIEEHAHVWSP